jgi:hypothetical protein
LKNFGVWFTIALLGLSLGKEFLDWIWWYNWEAEGEDNPAPLLCLMWKAWWTLRRIGSWLWENFCYPFQPWLTEMRRRFLPTELAYRPVDQDGRTPTEWLLISIIGVWEMENWYKDECDWEVKRKWDEFVKARGETEKCKGGERSGAGLL